MQFSAFTQHLLPISSTKRVNVSLPSITHARVVITGHPPSAKAAANPAWAMPGKAAMSSTNSGRGQVYESLR